QGTTWIDGTASWYAHQLTAFHRFPVPLVFESLTLIRIATWSTLAIEAALGVLIWIPRLRPWVLVAGFCLHLSLEYSMDIPLFQWVMITCLIAFVEPEA